MGGNMHNLAKHGAMSRTMTPPKGLAFEIEDLVLVREWTERNEVRFTIRLDHGSEDQEYDEVIVFHTNANLYCSLIMWRNSEAVFVQPSIGHMLQYQSVGGALEGLPVREAVVLTDITATAWPAV
jgi:hypothetical protein